MILKWITHGALARLACRQVPRDLARKKKLNLNYVSTHTCTSSSTSQTRICRCCCNKWIYAKNTFFNASGVVQFSKSYITICLYYYTLFTFEYMYIRINGDEPRQRRRYNVGKNLKRHQHKCWSRDILCALELT